ncbi:MAG: hypothetical protein LBE82_05090 [Chitinophagaceae bacterium]|jgi:hypothetical protein|nr:hypothetical protein [Chitinophagaceae bacterium]
MLDNSPDIVKTEQADFNNCIILKKEKAVLILSKVEPEFDYTTISQDGWMDEQPFYLNATAF